MQCVPAAADRNTPEFPEQCESIWMLAMGSATPLAL